VLGIIFFGGRWWTIQRGLRSARPAAWFLGSILARAATVLAGFYLVSQGDWRRLVACLLGFLASRILVMHLTQVPVGRATRNAGGDLP
jgi:F1F0 ATPase subunit 2